MKVLLDENISFRLKKHLNMGFDETKHLSDLGLMGASDEQIWRFAKLNGFSILTRDFDDVLLAKRFGAPPKLIHLRCDNLRNADIIDLASAHLTAIAAFMSAANDSGLEVKPLE